MENPNSGQADTLLSGDVDENASANQFSCQQCRSRKLKCDRVKPKCGRCVRLRDPCEYPQARRANIGSRKRVHELESKLEQLERLARGVEQSKGTEEPTPQQTVHQDQSELFSGNEVFTAPSSGPTPSQEQSQEDASFSELVSMGLFEQQPSPQLVEFLNSVYFEKWHFAAPMFRKAQYTMSLYLPPHMRPPMCLQYIVLALGADISKTHRQLAIPFYQRAKAYIQADEMRGDGQHFTTVGHAQAWSLIANFEAQQLFFAQSSMSFCRAVRVAQMLGLHRVDGEGDAPLSLLAPPRDWAEAEERRRTFWVIYCADRLVCGSTGWPAMINEQDIQTRLPASEKAFESGVEEPTSPLTSVLHQEGQNFSSFAGRVLAASLFYQAFQHSMRNAPEDQDFASSLHWRRHREIDNDLAALLHGLPDDLQLPAQIRCRNATFVNVIIHTAVICLHRAALARMQSSTSEAERAERQSRSRLVAAAEEIVNIFKMMPDANETLKNPMLTFSVYTAALVFLDQPATAAGNPDYRRQDNLDLMLRVLMLAARTWDNPVTRSMGLQLAVEMRQRGLDSAAVEKAMELPLGRSLVPILAQGDSQSSNFLFQISNSGDNPGNVADSQ